MRGEAFAAQEKFSEAAKDFGRVIALNPQNYDGHFNLGHALNGIGRYKDAIDAFDRALTITPDHTAAYVLRGKAKLSLGCYREANDDFTRALDVFPNNAWLLQQRAHALSYFYQYQEASSDLNRALILDPDSSNAYLLLSQINLCLGAYSKSLQYCNSALSLDAESSFKHAYRGQVYLYLNDVKSALNDFRRAWHIEQTDPNVAWLIEWCQLCQEARPSRRVAGLLEKIIEVDPKHYLAHVCSGVVHIIFRRFEDAIKETRKAHELAPGQYDPPFWSAVALACTGRWREAIVAIEETCRVQPDLHNSILPLPPALLASLKWIEGEDQMAYRKYFKPFLDNQLCGQSSEDLGFFSSKNVQNCRHVQT